MSEIINVSQIMKQYENENFEILPGIYSDNDTRLLYSFVRTEKPHNILDIAPREGRTTSAIINALIKNASESNVPINYYIFEKDNAYYYNAIKYLENKKNEFKRHNVQFNIFHDTNIINSPILQHIKYLDFLFIDANHDYILSKYLINNIAPFVRDGGYIHFHDMPYNHCGNGIKDIQFIHHPDLTHPDIVDENILRRLYPTIYNKYKEHDGIVNLWEGDMVYKFIVNNNYNFASSASLEYDFDLALYIHKITK